MKKRPESCPWQTRPTHKRNGQIQVDIAVPISYGYCSQDPDCSHCAGTGYKPNILLQLGRGTDTVPCPFCEPEKYRKAVERILAAKRS